MLVLLALLVAPTVTVSVETDTPDPAAERVRAYMDEAARAGFGGVVGVARDGDVLVREGYGPIAPG